jgi:hypothetical protein
MNILIFQQDEIYKLKSGFDKIITKYLSKELKIDVFHEWCILRPRLLLHATTFSSAKFSVSLLSGEYFYKNSKLFRFFNISQCDYSNRKKRWPIKWEKWVVHSSKELRKKRIFHQEKNHPKKAFKISLLNQRGKKIEKKVKFNRRDLKIKKKVSKQAKNI